MKETKKQCLELKEKCPPNKPIRMAVSTAYSDFVVFSLCAFPSSRMAASTALSDFVVFSLCAFPSKHFHKLLCMFSQLLPKDLCSDPGDTQYFFPVPFPLPPFLFSCSISFSLWAPRFNPTCSASGALIRALVAHNTTICLTRIVYSRIKCFYHQVQKQTLLSTFYGN